MKAYVHRNSPVLTRLNSTEDCHRFDSLQLKEGKFEPSLSTNNIQIEVSRINSKKEETRNEVQETLELIPIEQDANGSEKVVIEVKEFSLDDTNRSNIRQIQKIDQETPLTNSFYDKLEQKFEKTAMTQSESRSSLKVRNSVI